MNKKLLTIAAALVILAVVIAPVAATLPTDSPLPKGFPFNKIWDLLNDLQTQITALAARVTSLETAVENLPTTHLGEWAYDTYNANQAYTAATDGFVVVQAGTVSGGPSIVFGRPDLDADADSGIVFSRVAEGEVIGFTMPVRAGDEWQVVIIGLTDPTETYANIDWIPLTTE